MVIYKNYSSEVNKGRWSRWPVLWISSSKAPFSKMLFILSRIHTGTSNFVGYNKLRTSQNSRTDDTFAKDKMIVYRGGRLEYKVLNFNNTAGVRITWTEARSRNHCCHGKTISITYCRGTLLVAQMVEALRYKSEGRGFDSRWCHWNFSLT